MLGQRASYVLHPHSDLDGNAVGINSHRSSNTDLGCDP
jgi:hypothetical protein